MVMNMFGKIVLAAAAVASAFGLMKLFLVSRIPKLAKSRKRLYLKSKVVHS